MKLTPPDIFKALKTYHPEIAKNTLNFIKLKEGGNAIRGTLVNKQIYIFKFKGDNEWLLYYGAAARDFERRK